MNIPKKNKVKDKFEKFFQFMLDNLWVVYFLLANICFFWFKENSFINGGDLSWPVYFSNFFHYAFYIWDASVNFGYSASRQLSSFFPYATYGFLLESMGFSKTAIQATFFYISFSFSGLGTYLFCRKLEFGKTSSFIAGIIYMFSPYAMSVAWVPVYGLTFPFYCFLPLGLFCFVSFLTQSNWRSKIGYVVILSISFFGASYSNPVFFVLFIFLISFLAIFFLITHSDKKAIIQRYFLFILLYFLLNAYWIIPFTYDLNNQYALASNGNAGLISDEETLRLNSVSFYNAYRMTGLWAVPYEYEGDYYYDWHNLEKSPLVILFGYIPIVISVYIFLLTRLDRKRKILILFLWTLLLLSVLANSGFNAPGIFSFIDSLIYQGYLERAFRSVYLKLGFLIVLPLSVLTGYVLEYIGSKIKNISFRVLGLATLLTSFLIFTAEPFFNGQIIKSEGKVFPGYRVTIPKEYFDLKNKDKESQIDARYLSLPIPKSYNLLLNWDHGGYTGADFTRFFLNKPLVYLNDGGFILKSIVEHADCSNPELMKTLMGLANIKYIISHKDLSPKSAQSDYLTESNLDCLSGKTIEDNKYLKINSIDEDSFYPLVYTPQTLSFINFNQETDMGKYFSAIGQLNRVAFFPRYRFNEDHYEEDIKTKNLMNYQALPQNLTIEYKKINPIKYRIVFHKAQGFFPVILSESFDKRWKIYFSSLKASGNNKKNEFVSSNIKGTIQNNNLSNGHFWETWFQRSVDNNENHLLANGYANSWIIDTNKICENSDACIKNPDGTYDFEVIVEFWPQRLFYLGLIISGATLVTCIGYLLWCWEKIKFRLKQK